MVRRVGLQSGWREATASVLREFPRQPGATRFATAASIPRWRTTTARHRKGAAPGLGEISDAARYGDWPNALGRVRSYAPAVKKMSERDCPRSARTWPAAPSSMTFSSQVRGIFGLFLESRAGMPRIGGPPRQSYGERVPGGRARFFLGPPRRIEGSTTRMGRNLPRQALPPALLKRPGQGSALPLSYGSFPRFLGLTPRPRVISVSDQVRAALTILWFETFWRHCL